MTDIQRHYLEALVEEVNRGGDDIFVFVNQKPDPDKNPEGEILEFGVLMEVDYPTALIDGMIKAASADPSVATILYQVGKQLVQNQNNAFSQ